jgi:hypothetical protein
MRVPSFIIALLLAGGVTASALAADVTKYRPYYCQGTGLQGPAQVLPAGLRPGGEVPRLARPRW